MPELSLFRAAVAALAALLVLLVLLLALDWLLRGDTVPVRNLRFEGEFRHVTAEELEIAVRDAVRGNFLLLDLESIRRRVEALPWVHRAAVRRSWPRDIAIQFAEQQPAARWGASAWVNHVGEEIHVDGVDLPSDAPSLDGPAGTSAVVLEHYQGFSALLAPAGLGIKRLTMTARRTWEVELSALRAVTREADGMLVIVDREDAGRKLERFARLYQPVLASQATSIRRADLRYSNGLAVEWRSGGAATRPPKPAGSREPAPKEG
jgi:cell division protein FtsQ